MRFKKKPRWADAMTTTDIDTHSEEDEEEEEDEDAFKSVKTVKDTNWSFGPSEALTPDLLLSPAEPTIPLLEKEVPTPNVSDNNSAKSNKNNSSRSRSRSKKARFQARKKVQKPPYYGNTNRNQEDDGRPPGWLTAIRVTNPYARIFLGEFLGTFVLVVIADASIAQMLLTRGAFGSYLGVNFAFGLAHAFGVYVAGGVSGGHINPAVTFTMAALGRLRWKEIPVYWAGQYLGAFFGAVVVFGVYSDLIHIYGGSHLITKGDGATAGIFSTYPFHEKISATTLVFDQIVGTGLFLIIVMSLLDENNTGPDKGLVPLLIGFVVVALGLSYGVQGGFAINPARDLGPRLLTVMAGYGPAAFSVFNSYFWIPWVGPHVGALLGAAIYFFFVENNFPVQEEQEEGEE